ncbi:CGR1 family protein [Vibrio neonatus]|uniref:CGR1 family protein n=1 Tax=Vibrio neonatus TaxID=278860 RepID=UPI0021C3E2A4|nr:CGR1 family protein [Vibrio neonatus]
MIERVLFGITLGVVLWCFLREEKIDSNVENHPFLVGILALFAIAFIISSASFGIIFAGAAVIEITIGFAIANKVFGRPSFMSLEQYNAIHEQKRQEKQQKAELKRQEKQRKVELKAIKKAKRIEASKRRVKWYFIIILIGTFGYQVSLIWDNQPQIQTETATETKVVATKKTENTGKLSVPIWEYKAWRVASVNNYVMMNATNSNNGSFLGVLRRLDDCDSRTVMLTLKANLADHVDIYRKSVQLRFTSEKGVIASAPAKIDLIKSLSQGQYGQQVEYSIYPIPDNLISVFKHQSSVRVDIDNLQNFTGGVSLYGAKFDLSGFTATYHMADEACRDKVIR